MSLPAMGRWSVFDTRDSRNCCTVTQSRFSVHQNEALRSSHGSNFIVNAIKVRKFTVCSCCGEIIWIKPWPQGTERGQTALERAYSAPNALAFVLSPAQWPGAAWRSLLSPGQGSPSCVGTAGGHNSVIPITAGHLFLPLSHMEFTQPNRGRTVSSPDPLACTSVWAEMGHKGSMPSPQTTEKRHFKQQSTSDGRRDAHTSSLQHSQEIQPCYLNPRQGAQPQQAGDPEISHRASFFSPLRQLIN